MRCGSAEESGEVGDCGVGCRARVSAPFSAAVRQTLNAIFFMAPQELPILEIVASMAE
jgi:hypothetical protein